MRHHPQVPRFITSRCMAQSGRLSVTKSKHRPGEAIIDAADVLMIDGVAGISLLPGDRAEIVKGGTNWQTI